MERQKLIKENESYQRQLQTEKEKSNKLEILIEAGRLSGKYKFACNTNRK